MPKDWAAEYGSIGCRCQGQVRSMCSSSSLVLSLRDAPLLGPSLSAVTTSSAFLCFRNSGSPRACMEGSGSPVKLAAHCSRHSFSLAGRHEPDSGSPSACREDSGSVVRLIEHVATAWCEPAWPAGMRLLQVSLSTCLHVLGSGSALMPQAQQHCTVQRGSAVSALQAAKWHYYHNLQVAVRQLPGWAAPA